MLRRIVRGFLAAHRTHRAQTSNSLHCNIFAQFLKYYSMVCGVVTKRYCARFFGIVDLDGSILVPSEVRYPCQSHVRAEFLVEPMCADDP